MTHPIELLMSATAIDGTTSYFACMLGTVWNFDCHLGRILKRLSVRGYIFFIWFEFFFVNFSVFLYTQFGIAQFFVSQSHCYLFNIYHINSLFRFLSVSIVFILVLIELLYGIRCCLLSDLSHIWKKNPTKRQITNIFGV